MFWKKEPSSINFVTYRKIRPKGYEHRKLSTLCYSSSSTYPFIVFAHGFYTRTHPLSLSLSLRCLLLQKHPKCKQTKVQRLGCEYNSTEIPFLLLTSPMTGYHSRFLLIGHTGLFSVCFSLFKQQFLCSVFQ